MSKGTKCLKQRSLPFEESNFNLHHNDIEFSDAN